MKKFFLSLSILFCTLGAFANHITGGEMFYTLATGTTNTYNVTLKLYRDCFSTGAQLDQTAIIGIYDNTTGLMFQRVPVGLDHIETLTPTNISPCIQNPPQVCYQVGFYFFTVTLPPTTLGYTIVYQRCCRIAGINNILGSSNVGSTYTAQIPGTSSLPTAYENNSAKFNTANDAIIICASNSFCYDFGAVDPDATTKGDVLRYSFCTAYTGGSSGAPAPDPPDGPPFSPIPYAAPYDAGSPLGSQVTIDPNTGMVCGIAPPAGIYVITVCVTEFRNNVAIAIQRKDLQIKVGDCTIADALLKPTYTSCDGFSFTFSNEAPPSPLVTSWFWEFGDGNTSNLEHPTYTYADTGTYTIKLTVNQNQQCSDVATAVLKVYPGFFPGFTINGICANRPTQFTDTTKTRYGFVDTWSWDFGETSTLADTSHIQNPIYTYPNTGTKTVRFIVTNSKGCIDTVFKNVVIQDKPALTIPTRDTLMCNGDTIQIAAVGTGTFSWTPAVNIINANTATPQVFPTTTQVYNVQLDQNGCIGTDSVKVRVVNFVTLAAMPDTTICLTDSIRIRATGNALRWTWSPPGTISNPSLQNPMVLPPAGTSSYIVKGTIGKCVAFDTVQVRAVPYPQAFAGPDTTICYGTPAFLHASMVGATFTWTPTQTLSNPQILNPVANPRDTTSYILAVFDNLGCPKPKRDTVRVNVLPRILAFAGRDTAVVVGQPLQFTATGGSAYVWIPGTSLSATDIANPVGIYDGSFDSIRYKVLISNASGCLDSAFVKVRVFRTEPQVFVPSAFTPNKDGKNDVFRPIPVGITQIEYFRVFNRWGELVFSSSNGEQGWDGRIKGQAQGTGTFVWLVKAIDFTGKSFFAKGTVTLIR